MTGILLRNADLGGPELLDVRIASDVIAEIGDRLPGGSGGEELMDAGGGALFPGFCDHYLHLHAMAAAASSVQCGPPGVTGPAQLAAALAAAQPDEDGWIRGVGYTEEVAGDLDALALDRLHCSHPVRIQHRSGALWILNTGAVTRLGLPAATHPGIERNAQSQPTGRLWRSDDWLRRRLPRNRPPDLGLVGARLAELGITHVTDATPGLDQAAIGALGSALASRAIPQHIQVLGAPLGWAPAPEEPAPEVGPYKVVIADSSLPGLEEVTDVIRASHAQGRPVAVHCVTREALVLLLAALDDAGPLPGDRIEHAALIPAELIPRLRGPRLAVVTQPGFLAARGDDYLRDVPAAEHDDLYRARSLLEAGLRLALSSDAPYGPLDPWSVIDAAASRRTPSGQLIVPAERLTTRQALAAYLGSPGDPGGTPRRVEVGAPADLVLLHASRAEALASPSPGMVAATYIGGRAAWVD